MSSAGHILDAINRIKQNRALRASKRQKFKGSNRESIYSGADQTQKVVFKKVPKEKAQAVIKKIRQDFKLKRKRDIIYTAIFSLIFITVIIVLNLPNKNTQNSSFDNKYSSRPIEQENTKWNGNISEPLHIKNTDYYYIPILHGISGELDEHGFYNLKHNNMVGERTRNILFMDKECAVIGKLLNQDGLIYQMEVIPSINNNLAENILYIIFEKDSNEDEIINTNDRYAIYISDINGENLSKITDKPIESLQYDTGCLIFEYYKTQNSTDSIYGIYDIKNKYLIFTNNLDSIN
ncbi:hypothetical protein [Maribacter hydrothermalis]|uniref:Uncharacterized protein n=1 Tax=Maribacter hydrothermalis TaxID=1836467 RepID=A0A1B7Z143_9FLAO|nr:hypothetical protein [Maribacter hydrothermalis]APQ18089.1 hypothetical protein BTR34_12450 [Maribacter hydrothermalis]OBR36435.1 hypothetical protein A9200_08345 [Maribacter hydrothermalis]